MAQVSGFVRSSTGHDICFRTWPGWRERACRKREATWGLEAESRPEIRPVPRMRLFRLVASLSAKLPESKPRAMCQSGGLPMTSSPRCQLWSALNPATDAVSWRAESREKTAHLLDPLIDHSAEDRCRCSQDTERCLTHVALWALRSSSFEKFDGATCPLVLRKRSFVSLFFFVPLLLSPPLFLFYFFFFSTYSCSPPPPLFLFFFLIFFPHSIYLILFLLTLIHFVTNLWPSALLCGLCPWAMSEEWREERKTKEENNIFRSPLLCDLPTGIYGGYLWNTAGLSFLRNRYRTPTFLLPLFPLSSPLRSSSSSCGFVCVHDDSSRAIVLFVLFLLFIFPLFLFSLSVSFIVLSFRVSLFSIHFFLTSVLNFVFAFSLLFLFLICFLSIDISAFFSFTFYFLPLFFLSLFQFICKKYQSNHKAPRFNNTISKQHYS